MRETILEICRFNLAGVNHYFHVGMLIGFPIFRHPTEYHEKVMFIRGDNSKTSFSSAGVLTARSFRSWSNTPIPRTRVTRQMRNIFLAR